uniref:Uncharacterized protein n=1 Tax=Coprothermobacter proteolyticus (strain ATCC 35245 / DSM 5265 / OCM 4 / BT) TaxID=309798 RepID=B5Y6C6_COPPD
MGRKHTMAAPLFVNASYVGTIPGLPRVANKKQKKPKLL